MTKHERELKELRAQVKELTSRIAELSGDVLEEAEEAGEDYWNRMRDTMRDVREQWGERARFAREQGKEGWKRTDRYAHDHPWQLVAGAAAVGVLLGMLMKRDNE